MNSNTARAIALRALFAAAAMFLAATMPPTLVRARGQAAGVDHRPGLGSSSISAGATGLIDLSYDSVDPIYATSNGYWVVYAELDGVVQVVADSEKPGAWRMIMDDRTSPTKALVAVDRQARTGKYYVNYYAAVPQSFKGSQAPTAAQSRRVVPDIALYVSEFTVTKRSGKSRLSSTPGTANKHRATRTRSNP